LPVRRFFPVFAAVGALFSLANCALPPPNAGSVATFANPVLDSDFPDPAVIKDGDGFYYAYATQTERDGRWVNIQVARSRDLISWDHLGDALPVKPSWASKTQDFWAPHVQYDAGRYYLYYSGKPDIADERHGLCLAVATATRPEGPFTDMGKPLQCGEGFVNIDPMALDDPATGKRLLYWGSGFGPIKVQELASDRMSFAPGSAAIDLVWPNKVKDQFPVLIEGAWVTLRDGWYYLFYSGDNCCGAKANYAVMVARSRSATGPFEPFGGPPGSLILAKRGIWHAPGHNSVIRDENGRDWMVYHAVDVNRPRTKPGDDVNTRRILLIDPIEWRDDWPLLDGPSTGARPGPATN
jgi:arabinan endo-1,5-alpha-L-arabinosidase